MASTSAAFDSGLARGVAPDPDRGVATNPGIAPTGAALNPGLAREGAHDSGRGPRPGADEARLQTDEARLQVATEQPHPTNAAGPSPQPRRQ
ncbi:hypothetical protein Aple_104140 [Acrocarpospora pleiomorpha]|uniref:Uncharacterized protein n=2 Tax=Acrocarpospora pleiomorpha TaxID=90975 RepID=A0A5M3Y5D2_9ACTN|nr:hypothetical protein Aple_104140 [Acrocarpospora pleiomorpha]